MILRISRAEQLPTLCLVGRACNTHVGNATSERNVVHACVCRAIGAHQTGTIECKHHRQVLQGHIVNQLVVGSLQESGINGHNRLQAFAGHAGCKGHCMLFCNAHIVIAMRVLLAEVHHARAFAHGGCDAHQALVNRCHVAKPLAKNLGERWFWRHRWCSTHNAHSGIKFTGAVIIHRIGFSSCIALAFAGDDVQKLRARFVVQTSQRIHHLFHIVSIHRTRVLETQIFKHGLRLDEALCLLLNHLRQGIQRRRVFQHFLANFFGIGIKAATHQFVQIMVQGTNRRADGHVVVVQDDQQVAIARASIVQGLVGHASCQCAIANDRDCFAAAAHLFGGHGHAQCGRDAGGRVGGAKGVVNTFFTARKAA